MVWAAYGNEVIIEVVVPMTQIMPELQELGGEQRFPVSMVILKEMGFLGTLAMPTTPPPPSESGQSLAFMDHEGSNATSTHSHVTVGQVMSVCDKVAKSGVLASNSEAISVKELCDFLTCLEVASPRSGKAIACLWPGCQGKNEEGKGGSQERRQEE